MHVHPDTTDDCKQKISERKHDYPSGGIPLFPVTSVSAEFSELNAIFDPLQSDNFDCVALLCFESSIGNSIYFNLKREQFQLFDTPKGMRFRG